MAQRGTSLMDTFENDNEAFRAFTMHFVQKQFDYDYWINCKNLSLIVSIL